MLDYMEMLESLILAWKEKDVQLEEGKAEFYSSLYLHVFHSIAHSWHFFIIYDELTIIQYILYRQSPVFPVYTWIWVVILYAYFFILSL